MVIKTNKMASHSRAFLDVDSKIIENNLMFEECKPDLEEYKALLGLSDEGKAPWKLVTPKPGFVVKTTDNTGKKNFINICILDEVPEPKDLTEDQLLEVIEAQDCSDFRVPLSLQEPREELDKSGNPSMVYDVAINPKFYQKIESSIVFKTFLLQVTFDGLKDKFDVDLDLEGHVILRNRKCVGTIRPHRIRTTKTPYKPPKQLIQDVTGNKNIKKSVVTAKEKQSNVNYSLIRIKVNDTNFLFGEINFPNAAWAKDINLDIGEDRIIAESCRGEDILDVFIPFNLDFEKSVAEFSTLTKSLQFVSPIV